MARSESLRPASSIHRAARADATESGPLAATAEQVSARARAPRAAPRPPPARLPVVQGRRPVSSCARSSPGRALHGSRLARARPSLPWGSAPGSRRARMPRRRRPDSLRYHQAERSLHRPSRDPARDHCSVLAAPRSASTPQRRQASALRARVEGSFAYICLPLDAKKGPGSGCPLPASGWSARLGGRWRSAPWSAGWRSTSFPRR